MRLNRAIPREFQDMVGRELERDERIEWMDMPIPTFFSPAGIGAFLFGIPWTAFSVFWMAMAGWGVTQDNNAPGLVLLFPLFGLPFVLIGLGMLSAPIWVYRKALKTVYAITDRRAIIIYGGRTTKIQSYSPERLHDIHRREKRDGSGDIVFHQSTWRDSDGDRRTKQEGFFRISNVREVEQMLKQLDVGDEARKGKC